MTSRNDSRLGVYPIFGQESQRLIDCVQQVVEIQGFGFDIEDTREQLLIPGAQPPGCGRPTSCQPGRNPRPTS